MRGALFFGGVAPRFIVGIPPDLREPCRPSSRPSRRSSAAALFDADDVAANAVPWRQEGLTVARVWANGVRSYLECESFLQVRRQVLLVQHVKSGELATFSRREPPHHLSALSDLRARRPTERSAL